MRTSYFTAGFVLLALALAISLPAAAQTSAPSSPEAATPQAAPPQPSQPEPSQTAPPQAAPEQTAPQNQSGAAAESSQGHAQAQAQTQSAEDNPLNLTEEQKAKLRPIIADENQQMDAVRNDTSLTQEQKIEKANQIREVASPKIKAILSPEQLQKLAEMQQKAKQQGASPSDSQSPQK